MRDDLLKEQLMSYARPAADEAAQPDAAAIRRRARRHYRRVAAVTVAGVLLVVGLGVGLGLRRGDGFPDGRPAPTHANPDQAGAGPGPLDHARDRQAAGDLRRRPGRPGGGRPVRVGDDRTVGTGQTSQGITISYPGW